MKKRISIKDIAAELNISVTSVSFILNGKSKEKGISDALTERVLKYVRETGYKPNHLAKSLRTGKTKIISLLIENIADPFFSSIAGYLEYVADQRGYKIIYGSTKNEINKTRELINLFRDRHVDGFIITPSESLELDIISLINEKIPVVLFDRYYKSVKTDYVGMDNYESTNNGVQYLIQQGYKNIAFVTLTSDQTQMHDRLEGYKKAMKDHKLKTCIEKIDYSKVEQTAIYAIKEFIEKNKQIDALFFATSYLALKGLEVINSVSKSIPENYGLLAFDDHEIFRLFNPTITAVEQPVAEMSTQLFNLLLEQIDEEDEGREVKHIVIPAKLNLRKSTPPKMK
ncbi:LacI family DNA-binding transcriptional regulator [Mucilaginibacter sp. X5P1]|uniref:LacI family DNA-binding transcriptional regulator n=1 Tax=Mucilaginibacter sp. X5P1 TaxID=2723088 RepID=UPI00160B4EA9|nr:LacI family DNA-binding transcriptional regulator [Mucilaginibacter sp. X5P1]MBB6138310.1 LacI family transcriptional regulator [Mucilaginibacter sp. X5P1]